ncbi:MAG TPA: prepilin-type N-terminal cleavage/methylation domain-containing protein [Caulobacteraceae bacterium]|jgi:prepilin-type N-terminal cleavage/methylation domain-containing protein|nr:prepilin-type N-terminal cleavage/methylation domain-containing protein [Caulobacteraceae bacterium]
MRPGRTAPRGFALSELLVAVAIAGLIIGVLTFLNVDYISLGRRVSDRQAPYALGGRAERIDPCATPGGVLSAGDTNVVARAPHETATVLTLRPQTDDGTTEVMLPSGPAGAARQPVRVVVEATPQSGPVPRGPSVASIEVGGATAGVVSPRCDLPQICTYDVANAMCEEDEVNALAEPG